MVTAEARALRRAAEQASAHGPPAVACPRCDRVVTMRTDVACPRCGCDALLVAGTVYHVSDGAMWVLPLRGGEVPVEEWVAQPPPSCRVE